MLKSALTINTALFLAATLSCVLIAHAYAQSKYPILDRVAEKVVQKYQTSSCQQLAAERAGSKAGKMGQAKKEEVEERVVRMLHEDADMRKEFLNRVAAPIANKLFECGLIP
jgi:hypothetical protein